MRNVPSYFTLAFDIISLVDVNAAYFFSIVIGVRKHYSKCMPFPAFVSYSEHSVFCKWAIWRSPTTAIVFEVAANLGSTGHDFDEADLHSWYRRRGVLFNKAAGSSDSTIRFWDLNVKLPLAAPISDHLPCLTTRWFTIGIWLQCRLVFSGS